MQGYHALYLLKMREEMGETSGQRNRHKHSKRDATLASENGGRS